MGDEEMGRVGDRATMRMGDGGDGANGRKIKDKSEIKKIPSWEGEGWVYYML